VGDTGTPYKKRIHRSYLNMANNSVTEIPAPKRSWADIVKGKSAPDAPKPLKPAEKGSHKVQCTGEFLVMLGHYGWIMSLQNIDHPDADRHGGRIYLRRDDLRPGAMPKPHEEVTFFLYCDKDGLGAEDCFVTGDPFPEPHPEPMDDLPKSKPRTANKGKFRARPQLQNNGFTQEDAAFLFRADAQEFVPAPQSTMSADAAEFRPAPSMNPDASEFVPTKPKQGLMIRRGLDVFAINTKQLKDDDDDSDSDTESTASFFSGPTEPGNWSALFTRCAKAVENADEDSSTNSWYSDSDEDDVPKAPSQAIQWHSVASRCADAVGKIDQFYPWRMRNTAAATKMRAHVGDDIRWDVVMDAMAELDADARPILMPPPGLSPPGLVPPPGL
jgi:hypothetical protein